MAPEATRGSRKPRENQYIFNLGVKGRKTGLTVPDTGIRDENGLEPLDHLFSSPEKPTSRGKRTNGMHKNANATISSEEDMDMGESTIPEPTAVLTARQSIRMPPPRSKSPMKTYLQSPARRNPSVGPLSSPLRGSIVAPRTASVAASVRRKLDFSTEDFEANVYESSASAASPQKRGEPSSSKAQSRLTNGSHPALKPSVLHEDEADQTEDVEDDNVLDNGGDSYQMINGGDDEEIEQIEQIEEEQEATPEPELEPQPSKKGRGRPKAKGKGKGKEKAVEVEAEIEAELEVEIETEPEPVKTAKNSRSKTRKEHPEDAEERPAKKTRRSLDNADSAPIPAAKAKSAKATKPPKAKSVAGKAKLAAIAEAESPNIQHAPPLPRNNRGLFILRRETPMEGSSFTQSRYGRNSIKPVAYWKNEKIEYAEEEAEDGDTKFLLQKIKEVIRKDEVEEPRRRKAHHKPSKGKGKKRQSSIGEQDSDGAEAWEADPGLIYAEVRQWDPMDPVGAEAPEEEQEVAWSSAAIITKDVAGANFGFAKCLTMPFFGAGMVDFPAGAIKKPKNTRKMQMVFFVYTGRVQVTINGGEPFRVSKGGMWQVPRGNFYSIYNDGDKHSRVFFSQGCEVEEAIQEGEE